MKPNCAAKTAISFPSLCTSRPCATAQAPSPAWWLWPSIRAATLHQEQALRESQERYRDLFENSSEMIATLSPAGQFLYANPAWKRCFGLDHAALLDLDSFEELFRTRCRSEVAALFRRALDGEQVDRAPCATTLPTAACWNWS